MTTHLLYLHGFRSSPLSAKARRMANWVSQNAPQLTWWCPQLPVSPQAAVDLQMQGLASWPAKSTVIVGSSLGGFYASVLAERLGCLAVVLNPAVHPARDLAPYVGELQAWHSQDSFHFLPSYLSELQALEAEVGELTQPSRYFAVIATGDEVLDWREMAEHYRGCHLRIVEGSDHALLDFEQHMPHVLNFMHMGPTVLPIS